MWTLLQRVTKNLIVAIPTAMGAGFIFGVLTEPGFLQHLILPFTFLMVYPMMVTLKIRQVFEGGDLRAQIIAQFINFAVVPFLAFGLGLLFFRDQPYMALGLLLAGLVPTSGMTISWTGFAKGNVAAAVKMTVIGLTLGSIASPFYVDWLLGASVSVHMTAVMRQIGIIVFLPMIAGYLTQQALVRSFGLKAFQSRWAPRFPALSTLGVVGIVFIAIALKASAIAAAPTLLLSILPPLTLMYAANYLLSSLVGRALLPRGDAIAMVYGSVMRNLSIALAIALNAFGPQGSSAALVIAVAYIIQVQSAAWYVTYTQRLFGSAPEAPFAASTTNTASPAAAR
jgi:arsenite transporter